MLYHTVHVLCDTSHLPWDTQHSALWEDNEKNCVSVSVVQLCIKAVHRQPCVDVAQLYSAVKRRLVLPPILFVMQMLWRGMGDEPSLPCCWRMVGARAMGASCGSQPQQW